MPCIFFREKIISQRESFPVHREPLNFPREEPIFVRDSFNFLRDSSISLFFQYLAPRALPRPPRIVNYPYGRFYQQPLSLILKFTHLDIPSVKGIMYFCSLIKRTQTYTKTTTSYKKVSLKFKENNP